CVDDHRVQRLAKRRVLRRTEGVTTAAPPSLPSSDEARAKAQASALAIAPGESLLPSQEVVSAPPTPRPQPVIVYLILVIGSIAMLVPFAFMLSASLKTYPEVAAGTLGLPKKVQWQNYPESL